MQVLSDMKLTFPVMLFLFFAAELKSQCNEDLAMYKHFQIQSETDTINYHIYSKKPIDSVGTILLFIQGSGAMPLFQIDRNEEGMAMVSSMPFDLESFPDNCALALVSKRNIPFCTKLSDKFRVPKNYYLNEGINDRAERINLVINDIGRKKLNTLEKIVLLGHSEGSDVVAKVGTLTDQVSHFGYWSGGGNTQLYDFVLFIRKDVLSGKITKQEGIDRIDSLFAKFKDIRQKPNSISDFWEGHTFRRWNTFIEPPIENLLKINAPIFVAHGAKDASVPVESSYLIPIEFIRKNKTNLEFRVYPELDHGFEKELQNGIFEDHWNDVFTDFLEWVNEKDQKK
jgi:pimeloyl-ACP methyl ester carboxylesterase